MKATGMLAVALTAMFAVSPVFTPAKAGGVWREGTAMPAQPSNIAPGGGAAFDKTKAVRGELENADKDLQASDKLGNSEIERASKQEQAIRAKEKVRKAQEDLSS